MSAAIGLALLGANGSCQPIVSPNETVYGLGADSTFTHGCFPPFACRAVMTEDVGGTFRIRLVQAGGLVDRYEVRDVYWIARFGSESIPITVAASFLDGVSEDQLLLELRVGDAEPERFTRPGRGRAVSLEWQGTAILPPCRCPGSCDG